MINIDNGYKISIMLTERCNLRCSHCYMSANTLGNTLTIEQINTLIEKLPYNAKRISITGGEPYMCKKELYYILQCIKKKFGKEKDLDIRVETNTTFFYQSKESIEKELRLLIGLGVTTLRVSDDKYHIDGGLDPNKLKKVKEVIVNNKLPIIYSCLYQESAVSFGRAKDLPKEEQEKMNCLNRSDSLSVPYFYSTIDGDISTCAWKCAPILGNIFKDSFDIIINNLNNPIQLAILNSNIKKVIDIVCKDDSQKHQKILKILEDEGQCMACQAMFKGKYNEKTIIK